MTSTHTSTLMAVTVTMALVGPASANARSHVCRQGDPPITASVNTSCPFAGAMVDAYANHRPFQARVLRTWVDSPVTHKRYWITFRLHGSRMHGYVTATGRNNIWIQFSAML